MMMRRPSDRQIVPLRSALQWLFDDPWTEFGRMSEGVMTPSIDLRETDDAYVVEAEMPGVKPDDADVSLDGRTLIIRGQFGSDQRRSSGEGNGQQGRYLIRERSSGSYVRQVMLPGDVDADRVESTFENGELTVTLPKAAHARTRRIPVSSGAGGAKSVGG